MLVRYTIPIDSYCGDEVFEKHVYVECDTTSLTLQKLVHLLKKANLVEEELSKEHPECGPFTFEYAQCLQSLALLDHLHTLPIVTENELIQSTVFIQHPRWGRQHISVSIIVPLKLGLFDNYRLDHPDKPLPGLPSL